MVTRLEGGRRKRSGPALVSIVVVVLNARAHLPEVLESIFARQSDDLELIVIDGASRDSTQDYLREHDDRIDYWLSEPDRGIYDAMTKAIAHATGTFLLHLNVGDTLIEIPRNDLLNAGTDVALLSYPVALSSRRKFKPAFGPGLRFENTLHHQGTFYRRSSFLVYDMRLPIFADFDVNQRLALAHAKATIGTTVVAFHATDGISNEKTPAAIAEFLSIIRKNYGQPAVALARLIGKWRGLKRKLHLA